jgi:hypothetical protein
MTDELDRLDRLEARAWADLITATPEPARRQLGLAVEHIGPAMVLSSTGEDSLLLNRVIGLRGDDLSGVRRALRHFAGRGVDRFFLQIRAGAGDHQLGRLLRSYGIERHHHAWEKFSRGPSAPPEITTDLLIRGARPDDAAACGRLIADGFDAPGAGPVFAAAIGRPGWRVFVGCDHGDRPVAAGALFVHGDQGYLAFAATAPGHRRRGAQGALIARRIRDAIDQGCATISTEIGEPVAKDPGSCRANMLRAGFALSCRRENYAPIGTSWTRPSPPEPAG